MTYNSFVSQIIDDMVILDKNTYRLNDNDIILKYYLKELQYSQYALNQLYNELAVLRKQIIDTPYKVNMVDILDQYTNTSVEELDSIIINDDNIVPIFENFVSSSISWQFFSLVIRDQYNDFSKLVINAYLLYRKRMILVVYNTLRTMINYNIFKEQS